MAARIRDHAPRPRVEEIWAIGDDANDLQRGQPLHELRRAHDQVRGAIDMQHCPNCGAGELKIVAAILERPVIEKILTHLGLEPQPPPRGRVREAGQD